MAQLSRTKTLVDRIATIELEDMGQWYFQRFSGEHGLYWQPYTSEQNQHIEQAYAQGRPLVQLHDVQVERSEDTRDFVVTLSEEVWVSPSQQQRGPVKFDDATNTWRYRLGDTWLPFEQPDEHALQRACGKDHSVVQLSGGKFVLLRANQQYSLTTHRSRSIQRRVVEHPLRAPSPPIPDPCAPPEDQSIDVRYALPLARCPTGVGLDRAIEQASGLEHTCTVTFVRHGNSIANKVKECKKEIKDEHLPCADPPCYSKPLLGKYPCSTHAVYNVPEYPASTEMLDTPLSPLGVMQCAKAQHSTELAQAQRVQHIQRLESELIATQLHELRSSHGRDYQGAQESKQRVLELEAQIQVAGLLFGAGQGCGTDVYLRHVEYLTILKERGFLTGLMKIGGRV
eukprot:TRINITY_DN5424_c0_g1_i4.p1 TRINITY_DN5424_c0_g1~~TRINITY_DN5424_c0_g1_i4.p1  ORF type:complete len:398 (-),score=71.33 TRINITY_DN5424_c0_g1_i4:748-1941(-)